MDQVRDAFAAVMRGDYGLASVKAFWVHSTGRMGILDHAVQRRIWQIAGEIHYDKVFFQHLEDEDAFTGEFDPKNPLSHSLRQNQESETIQVERQIRNAVDAKFEGVFYIAHVSNPDTVDFIESFKNIM